MLSIERKLEKITSPVKDMKVFSNLKISLYEIHLINNLLNNVNKKGYNYEALNDISFDINNVRLNIECDKTDNIRIMISHFMIDPETKKIYLVVSSILNENTGDILSDRMITIELYNDSINTNFFDNFVKTNYIIFDIFKDLKLNSSPRGTWINTNVF
jgi:hypothetical protein